MKTNNMNPINHHEPSVASAVTAAAAADNSLVCWILNLDFASGLVVACVSRPPSPPLLLMMVSGFWLFGFWDSFLFLIVD